jgi:4-methylaminobutanoate oxidase (formaldehyde-forming)
MHWPYRQPETARGARRSILHEKLAAAGACFGETAGWERANWFARSGEPAEDVHGFGRQNWFEAQRREHLAAREAVALFDQSSFAKYLVQGSDAGAVLNRLGTAEMDVPVGRVVYTQWLNPRGGIEADLTVTRTGAAEYLVVTAAATQRRDLLHLRRGIPEGAQAFVTDVTSGMAVLGLMGPRARAVLTGCTTDDVSDAAMPYRSSREIALGSARVRATRISYVGELGWELYIPTEFAPQVFELLVAAGAAQGLCLAGYRALNALRLEKAYRHWGHDIDTETTPLEAGLGFCIAWDKPGGFVGREALLAQRAAGLGRRLVQFRLADPEATLFHDEPIWRDGQRVGRITSGMHGHTLGAPIGLGYVNGAAVTPEFIRAGRYEIEIGARLVPAEASLAPMFDPKGARLLG